MGRAASDAAQGGMSGFGRVLRLELAAKKAQRKKLDQHANG